MCLLALTSCSQTSSDEDIRVGQLYLRSEVTAFGTEASLFRAVQWAGKDSLVGELRNDRIPDWAKGFATACVQWEEDFTRTLTLNSDTDSPQQIIQTGHADGWILVGDSAMVFHILELTIEFEGVVYEWIDAWDPPE